MTEFTYVTKDGDYKVTANFSMEYIDVKVRGKSKFFLQGDEAAQHLDLLDEFGVEDYIDWLYDNEYLT